MVVVLAARLHGLVAGGGCADVDALDEAVARQLLEGPVDARDPDRPALGPEGVEDLLRSDTARLAAEQLDHGPAGGAVPASPLPQRLRRDLHPAHVFILASENDYR